MKVKIRRDCSERNVVYGPEGLVCGECGAVTHGINGILSHDIVEEWMDLDQFLSLLRDISLSAHNDINWFLEE